MYLDKLLEVIDICVLVLIDRFCLTTTGDVKTRLGS